MKHTPVFVLLAGALLLAVAPGVAAQSASVAVSGQCYDEDNSGGHDSLSASSDGSYTLLTVTGTVDAVSALTDDPEAASSGNGCSEDYADSGDYSEDQDHLSVVVTAEGQSAEACYTGTVETSGCPSSPSGAPPSDE